MKLEHLIGTKSRIALLRHLCGNPERDFSVVELADEVGIHKSLVSRLVREMERERLILTRERRNLKLCQINTKAGAYRMLVGIFESEKVNN
jgi:DNA-binding MarR family transcriptional regulator